ncbi:MAG TPA: DUF979 domain-containing protein [Rheinheimera sp.]|nr:DUF979 domain-containing protein [Rheinheimera sp.]
MISSTSLYPVLGLILLVVAWLIAADRQHPSRWSSSTFWALYGLIFLIGDWLPPALIGAFVLLMALVAGTGRLKRPVEPAVELTASNSGRWLFGPALLLPVVTLLGAVLVSQIPELAAVIDPSSATLVCLGLACAIAFGWTLLLTKESPVQGVREQQRLLEAMGFAVILPQLLAVLGLLFNQSGVGKGIAELVSQLPLLDSPLIAVVLYCSAMALFTVIMGNAFAAFPVITAGIGIPILMGVHQANPAVVAAIGMFCGYCGTLMTPMAANFNLVPALLLGLRDQHAVIRAQLGTALPLLFINMLLMYQLAF